MQQPPKPNAFTLSARSSIAIDLQRRANNAHEPKPQHQIVIYPPADQLKRQRIAKASI